MLFEKLSVKDMTAEDVKQIELLHVDDKEMNAPFEGGDYIKILRQGCDKLNALKKDKKI